MKKNSGPLEHSLLGTLYITFLLIFWPIVRAMPWAFFDSPNGLDRNASRWEKTFAIIGCATFFVFVCALINGATQTAFWLACAYELEYATFGLYLLASELGGYRTHQERFAELTAKACDAAIYALAPIVATYGIGFLLAAWRSKEGRAFQHLWKACLYIILAGMSAFLWLLLFGPVKWEWTWSVAARLIPSGMLWIAAGVVMNWTRNELDGIRAERSRRGNALGTGATPVS